MQSFRVTIHLVSPMQIPQHPIHLDGVLSRLRVDIAENSGDPDPWATQHDLPLERYHSPSGQWVFKASVFRGRREMEPFVEFISSRPDVGQVAEDIQSGLLKYKRARLSTVGGYFKGSAFMVHAQWVRSLSAEGVGDIDRVRNMLSGLEYFGGKRANGFGEVERIEVEEIDRPAQWQDRVLPSDAQDLVIQDKFLGFGALRAPYWKKTNFSDVFLPIP